MGMGRFIKDLGDFIWELGDFIQEWRGLLRNGEVYPGSPRSGVLEKFGIWKGPSTQRCHPKPGLGTHLSWVPPPPHPAPLALENNDPEVGKSLQTPFLGFCGCPLEHPHDPGLSTGVSSQPGQHIPKNPSRQSPSSEGYPYF